MKSIEVVAAIVASNGKILCTQRGPNKHAYIASKYEFPGGKLESGESRETAIKREITEELNLTLSKVAPFLSVTHRYPDFEVTLHSFLCECDNVENLQLAEHINHKWLPRRRLHELDWAAADIPIVHKLQSRQ